MGHPVDMFGFSVNCVSFLLVAISINSVFFALRVNLFVSSQEFTLCKSLLILFSISGNEEPKVDIFVSSANMEAWVCLRQFGRSLIYNVKSNGRKLDPCGIPHAILFKCELVP